MLVFVPVALVLEPVHGNHTTFGHVTEMIIAFHARDEQHQPKWSPRCAIGALAGSTVLVALMSEGPQLLAV